ncbi:MAG: peptidase M48 [Gemmatimonadota bacterium]|nr:MAG: peptidase M48 [Gemmatimonadota bacterium]
MSALIARCRSLVIVSVATSLMGCATVGQINLVSEPEELAMGDAFAGELEKELRFITDPTVVGYIEALGQSLARVSQRSNITYRFHVVDTDEVNAFAVPGGYLYVNRGLIEAADTEAELAGVLGHEIGHVVGKHSARQMTQQLGISAIAGMLLGQDPGMLAQLTTQIVATGAITSYSRDMESEADTYGVQELYDAGIDPNGLATFFRKLEDMRGGQGGGTLEQFFSTHPDPGARAEAVLNQIASLPPKSGLRKDSAAFREAKARVLALPRPPSAPGQ